MTKVRAVLATLFVAALPAAAQTRGDVGPHTNSTYVKECGSCHFAFQPGFLPASSWQRIMASLKDHFGESAELNAAASSEITGYLAESAADRGRSQRGREVAASIPSGQVPVRITQVPYIAGIHGGMLDPARNGRPVVKSLIDCSVCHPGALEGSYSRRIFSVNDELFRRVP